MPTIPKTGMPLQLQKMYAGPLTDGEIFESLELATAYAAGTSAYPGQIISVKTTIEATEEDGEDTVKWSVYVIQEDKTLSLIGAGSEADLDELTLRVDGHDTAIQNIKTGLAWKVLAE